MAENAEALLARISLGDHDALHALYVELRPRLWRYLAGQYGLNATSLEDAVQEIFLTVWRAAPTYREQGNAVAWVYTIARHHVTHARRDDARRPQPARFPDPCNESGPQNEVAIPSFEEPLLARLALDDALARLSAPHREVLILAFQHGFSLQEVAQIQDVPVGTVKSRINYARRALIREYAAADAHEEDAR